MAKENGVLKFRNKLIYLIHENDESDIKVYRNGQLLIDADSDIYRQVEQNTSDITALNGRVTEAEEKIENILDDYTDLVNDVTDLKSAVEHLTDNLINVTTEASNPLVITDGADGLHVKDCVVNIQPSQPNNYNSVWVGGAGKNKLPVTMTSGSTSSGIVQNVDSFGVVTLTGTTSSANYVGVVGAITLPAGTYIVNGIASNSYSATLQIRNGSASGTTLATDSGSGAQFTLESETAVAVIIRIPPNTTISNSLVVKPMIRLSSVSDDTWTPYSNICPISGWTEADIHRCGVNQWDEEWEVGAYNGQTGEKVSNASNLRCKNAIPVLPSTTYYFKSANAMYVFEYDSEGAFLGYTTVLNNTYTTKANTHFLRFYLLVGYGTTYNNDISINYPSTDTSYHAYTGTTYSVDLSTAGTVYGGTLDVTTGVLTVTKKMLTLNGSEKWATGYYAIGYRYYIRTPQSDAKNETAMQSSAFNKRGEASLSIRDADAPKCVNFYANAEYGMFKTLSEFTTYLASNPVQAVYELATPQTYQLAPTEVTTLLKNNTLTANCGTVSLSYYADTKSYIDNAIATAVASL